ncbi:uncharacterized protein LOC124636894 [Helicoverpa zea]|uniref:uncharacterized protein LOC124636894 n=1 Tax=Helicoverpa zea TaxID=7113 RepID=UPI001F562812|nr:uncharacterized protein LOC124636894 [Helicoverpa zea]
MKMYHLLIFLSYLTIVVAVSAPTHLLITRAGPCYDDLKSKLVTVSELSLSTQTLHSLLSGEFNISEHINNGWKIKATMQKCVDIRNMETCDLFRTYNLVKNGCDDGETLNEKQTYAFLFYYTQPKIKCPIQAGRYKLVNYPVFTEDNYVVVRETKISTSVFGYTFRLDGFIKRRKIFCVEAILQLMYTRKHNWADRTSVKETTSSRTTTVDDEEE